MNHRKPFIHFAAMITLCLILQANARSSDTLWIADLNLHAVDQGWGEPGRNQSVDGHPLTIAGRVFLRGLGTHAVSSM
ncbi:NPCBM/NEW2 domain-containing protein, partial [candidate division KSB1 bacterium]|nr:NPCBM/NEW2 domain-containing protein [candidate division KSB1 bacterium]